MTLEHVVPKWVQRRFNLWDQTLNLLNGTSIPYRYLTVPCCEECNKYQLKPIEGLVAAAVARGAEQVQELGNRVLFLWLGKILYGLLYKELFLSWDRRNPSLGMIVEPDSLRSFFSLLFFLQQARGLVQTMEFSPASIFIFRTQSQNSELEAWDFCDNPVTLFIACRMADVGLVAVLGDGGAQQPYEEAYRELRDVPLSPLQFREICAQFSYRSTLVTQVPKYMTMEGPPHKVLQLPLAGMSQRPLFDDWDPKTYAKHLAFYTGYKLEELFTPPDMVKTWLWDCMVNPYICGADTHACDFST